VAQEVTGDPAVKPVLKKFYTRTLVPKKKDDMGKLSYEARKEMPKKDFAVPKEKDKENPAGKGGYPIEDKAHARDALARVSADGNSKEKAEVREKVEKKYPDIEQTKGAEAKKEKMPMHDWLKAPRRERKKRGA